VPGVVDTARPRSAGVAGGAGAPPATPEERSWEVSAMSPRWGVTIPFSDQPLREEVALYREAEARGYTDLWTSEVDAGDGFTPLVAAAGVTSAVRLGTAIVSVYTRAPAILAMQAA